MVRSQLETCSLQLTLMHQCFLKNDSLKKMFFLKLKLRKLELHYICPQIPTKSTQKGEN
jgi:hypothetical protein